MREILFRGKRIDNGKWVQGYYAKAKDYMSEKEIHVIFPLDLELFPHSEFSSYEEVAPETVGQYIGQTDKRGKKIFEGDIIENTPSWRRQRELLVILFKETSFCTIDCESFRKNKLANAYPIDDCDYGVYIDMFEVVGNIHDNPELIGGAE